LHLLTLKQGWLFCNPKAMSEEINLEDEVFALYSN